MKECEFKKECESVSGECMFHRKEDCKLTRKFAILVQEKTVKDTLEMMESFRTKPLLQEQSP